MKTDFAKPRFTGARFDEHTLPVEVAQDLVAYETLIVELAKHLYLQDNPNRQRVPKGFATDFHLDIVRIEEGSTQLALATIALSSALSAGTADLVGGEQIYFEKARELISECVAAPENALPANFPKELLVHFNRLGRSLRSDETLELPRSNAASATLTQDKRKQLVLAAEQVYEREVTLVGAIVEVDAEKASFRLRLRDGGSTVVPMPDSFLNNARLHLGRPRDLVIVSGVAAYDSWEHLQKVITVESFEVVKNYEMALRFDDLSQLKDGWFEGMGYALNQEKLSLVAEKLVGAYPDRLLLPAIFPTQEGNLLLEWDAVGVPSLDIQLDSLRSSYHAFDADGGDVERDFDLANDKEWGEMYSFLGENIKVQSA